MKKSKMINIILKELKKWESCKIEKRTATSLLKIIEKAGMLPPSKNSLVSKEDMKLIFDWENEK